MTPRRILLVDDDPAVRDILAAILRRDGWIVDTAADGVSALARIDEEPYSVIVLDLLMPLMGGEGVIAYIKERGIRTPVVVVSGAQDHSPLDPQIVAVVLQKPIEIADLRVVLRAISESAVEAW